MLICSCINLILNGSNDFILQQADCLCVDLLKFNCNVGYVNPPYAQKQKELLYVEKLLDSLIVGGVGFALIPQSCMMTSNKENVRLKKKILVKHSLYAVMSMPDKLFGDSANAVTCLVVFIAHRPHKCATWFGYYKNDGFEQVRNRGRVDINNLFKTVIKSTWTTAYLNRCDKFGFSINKQINGSDEWLIEPYMKTDYNNLSNNKFELIIKDYIIFLFYNGYKSKLSISAFDDELIDLNVCDWVKFNLFELFEVKGSSTTSKRSLQEMGNGIYPYITTSSLNNGTEGFYNHYSEQGNVLVIDSAVKGSCSYQVLNFSASDHVEKLIPKFKLNKYNAMFLIGIISLECYRYSYGRKFNQTRIKQTEILLPTVNNEPDWEFMERYIKSLKYSGSL